MIVKVHEHIIEIEETPVNEKEINVTKIKFEFDEVMQDFVKEAYFTYEDNTYKVIIQNDECYIPNEVLNEQGTIELGVVAFKIENESEIRFNPKSAFFPTWSGSLKEADNTEPITPSEMEQYEQQLQEGLDAIDDKIDEVDTKIETIDDKIEEVNTAIEETNNLDINVSNKVNKEVTITLTKKDNTTKSVKISDGLSLQFMWQGTSLGIKTDDMQDYVFVDLQGVQGVPGPQGQAFTIKKTYSTIELMKADYDNMEINDYVMIDGNIEEQDNAKMFVKQEIEDPVYRWHYLADFSGASGIQGPTGATPNIQIGTVSSGAIPSVTRTGTDENPILNFVLQKGDKGDKGNTGDTGATGNGISSIEKTSETSSQTDYRINYTNGEHFDYTVENGEVTQSQLDEVIEENNYLNSIINQIVPKVSGSGEYITLNDTIEAKMDIDLYAKLLSQDGTPTPSSPQDIHTISGSNTLKVEGKNKITFDNLPSDTSIGVTSSFNNSEFKLNGTTSISGNLITQRPLGITLSAGTYFMSYKIKSGTYSNIGQGKDAAFYLRKRAVGTAISTVTLGQIMTNGGEDKRYGASFTIDKETELDFYAYANSSGIVLNNLEFQVQLENGNTMTDYQEYQGLQTANIDLPVENLLNANNVEFTPGSINWFGLDGIILNNPSQLTGTSIGVNVKANKTYTFSISSKTNANRFQLVYVSGTNFAAIGSTTTGTPITFTPTADTIVYPRVEPTSAGAKLTCKLQIEKGTKANAYTPYGTTPIEYCKIGNYEDKFVKGDGTNLLPTDENSWEQGSISAQTGENTSSTTRIRTKDYYPIENDTDYYVSIQNTNYCVLNIEFYNAQKTYINSYYTIDTNISGATSLAINIPSSSIPNVAYMRVVLRPTDNTSTILPSAISTILPMINKGTTYLPFEPYGTGWYLKKNIGKVDLGTLSYSKVTNATYGDYFKTSDITNAVKQQTYYSTSFNALCNSYRVAGRNVNEFLDNTFVFDGTSTAVTEIQFKNSNYSDATTFKNSLSGVYLYYPILTQYLPITGTLSNQLDNIKSKLLSQKGQTNISQVNNDLPFEISVSALGELNV